VTVIYPRERGADAAFLKAVTNLALLTDAVERPGAGLMPLVRETNQQGAIDALGKLEFLVVQDFAMTETAKRAHVVLPGLTFAEKDGSYTNLEGRVQRIRQALESRGEGRPDWRVFRDVLNSLGGMTFAASADD